MSTATLMNVEELKQWILRRLGAPLVKVELIYSEEHINDAIEDAKRWFSAKKGVRKAKYVDIPANTSAYELDDDIDIVFDVAFQSSKFDPSSVFSPFLLPDQQLPTTAFGASSSMGLYSQYTQVLQYIETAKRVLGAEAEWRQDGRTLYLFPAAGQSMKVMLDYKAKTFAIEQLSERDHDLVKRFALAKTKQDLVTIRGKYPNGFPTAQGQIGLDWERLAQEATTELQALEEEIGLSGMPMGFLTG